MGGVSHSDRLQRFSPNPHFDTFKRSTELHGQQMELQFDVDLMYGLKMEMSKK